MLKFVINHITNVLRAKECVLMTSHVNIYFCRCPLQNKSLEKVIIMSHFLSVSCWNRNNFPYLCIIADERHDVVRQMRILIHSGFAIVN